MKRIYCDGIFDLFHDGHLKHFQKIKEYFNEKIYLIVGVISDKTATNYKRIPVFNEQYRQLLVNSCKYTDEGIIQDKLIIDKEMINELNIDYVIYAFNNNSDEDKQNEFFQIPIEMGIFKKLKYNKGISTSKIIKNYSWKNISLLKKNLKLNQNNNYLNLFNLIKNKLKIDNNKENKILEINCKNGLLSNYFKNYNLICVEKNKEFVKNHFENFKTPIINFDYDIHIFKNNFFDYSIFNFKNFGLKKIKFIFNELEKITKYGIYISKIPNELELKKLIKDFNYEIIYHNNYYDIYKLFYNQN